MRSRETPETFDRRTFLTTLGASLGAAALGCARGVARGGPDTTSAAGAASVGVTPALGPVGLQLYTVRTEMQKSVEATLARVARIGYKGVEFAGYFQKSPQEIRALLDADGLRSPSTHIPIEVVRDQLDATLDAAKTIGHEYVVVPWLPENLRGTLDDWRRTAELLNRSGAAAQRAGLRLGYHNHDFEFRPVDGKLPYDVLLAETDPTLVVLEMDLYWATKAGQDPVAYFGRYPGRFHLVHVKDSKGAPEHRMTEVGSGTIDWRRIFSHREQAGIRHYFVEHDQPADPFASIEASYRYLARLTV